MKLITALLATLLVVLLDTPVDAQQFEKCVPGQKRSSTETCVVDGDTFWLHGTKMRLMGIDTPEPYTNRCGGDLERELAAQASARLLDLLNSNEWTYATHGLDNTRKRTLITVYIKGVDVGRMLVDEGLARYWPDGIKFWCKATIGLTLPLAPSEDRVQPQFPERYYAPGSLVLHYHVAIAH